MKKEYLLKKIVMLSFVFLLLFFYGCDSQSGDDEPISQTLSGDYLGQTPPGTVAELFAPEFFTFELYTVPVFSPAGDEVCWRELDTDNSEIFMMKQVNGVWEEPEVMSFANGNRSHCPFFSDDGNRLYFTSFEQVPGITKETNEYIWYVDREGENWTNPIPMDSQINSYKMHYLFSLSSNGNIYFTNKDENDDPEILVSYFNDRNYESPIKLENSINSERIGVSDSSPFIAPDETYLIFSKVDVQVSGYAELYISFKKSDGSWTIAQPIEQINELNSHEMYPTVSNDGQYLFFLSNRNSNILRPYWVRASVLDDLRPQSLK